MSMYHEGQRVLQDRFDGRRVADGLEKHRLHFTWWDQDRKLIEEARFFFIATSYGDTTDCSMRSTVVADGVTSTFAGLTSIWPASS